jgi:hypothetical protein
VAELRIISSGQWSFFQHTTWERVGRAKKRFIAIPDALKMEQHVLGFTTRFKVTRNNIERAPNFEADDYGAGAVMEISIGLLRIVNTAIEATRQAMPAAANAGR